MTIRTYRGPNHPRHCALALAVLALCMLSAYAKATAARDVTVAVAANFAVPVKALVARFETDAGHRVRLVVGSSGKLFAQIANGAPFDVFLSADAERPRRLVEAGHAVRGSRFTFATGRLVLLEAVASRQRNPERESVSDEAWRNALARPDVRTIAIANPRLAPYGKAASELLRASGVASRTGVRIVRGENVGQAFALLATGNADAAFVAMSQVLSHEGAIWHPVPPALHSRIEQDAVLTRIGERNAAAREFLEFLRRPENQALIVKYGYLAGS